MSNFCVDKCTRSEPSESLWIAVAAWVATNGVAIAAALLTAFLMSGCALHRDIEPSSMLMTTSQLASHSALPPGNVAASVADVQWWKSFNDAQLDRLIDEALQDNADGTPRLPSLRLARARLAKAMAMTGVAEAARGVKANASVEAYRNRFSANYIYPPPFGGGTYTSAQLAANLSYDLDFWGRNEAALNAATAQAHAAEVDVEAARLALTTSIARSWFQFRNLTAQHAIAEAAVHQSEQFLDLTQQRVNAGLDTRVELRQAEAAVPIARIDVRQIDDSILLIRNQIAALLGQGPDRAMQIEWPADDFAPGPMMPGALALDLLGRRPDLQAARWRVEAAVQDIHQARAQFYPNINLVASFGLISLGANHFLSTGSENAMVGPAISLPLFGNSLRANLRGKTADYDAAVESYNQSLIDAVREVDDQIGLMQNLQPLLAEQQVARQKTEEAYELAVQRYRAGITNFLTVLNLQTTVHQQQRLEANLKANALDVQVNLIRALGGGYSENALVNSPQAAGDIRTSDHAAAASSGTTLSQAKATPCASRTTSKLHRYS